MTKPPHIAALDNLFHPQNGEKCIIQPLVDYMFWVKNSVSEIALTIVFNFGLSEKPTQHVHFKCANIIS